MIAAPTERTDLALRGAGGIPAQCRYGDQPQGWKSGRRTLGSCTYLRARGMALMHQHTVVQTPSGSVRKGSRHARTIAIGLATVALLTGAASAAAQSPSVGPAGSPGDLTVTDDT